MRNLAFLAQGSGGVADHDRRTVVLPQAIIESAMFYQEEGKGRKIEISLLDRATQNRVSGHPELIRQVIMNLLDNCIKYGASNSTIEVNQWVNAKTSNAIITIKGQSRIPIRPDEIVHIFDLGFRGSNARKIVASGTGLGLYICRQIIEKVHAGSLSAQADGPNGLLFTLRLPRGERGS